MATFTVIEADTLASNTTSWTSGTIPTTYDHLYITMSAKGAGGLYSLGTTWQFNGDTGSNYSHVDIQTTGSTPTTYDDSGSAIGYPCIMGAAGNTAMFGLMKIWIPNYANTANYKQALFESYAANYTSGSSYWGLKVTSGQWLSTAAITSFTTAINGGTDFLAASTYTIYGVNGA